MLHAPAPSPSPMLYVQVQPRHSIYDSSESKGDFVVEASISYTHGEPYSNRMFIPGSDETLSFDRLKFDIRVEEHNSLLVSSGTTIDAKSRLFQFDLTSLQPRLGPYEIILYGAPTHSYGYQNYTAKTQLYYLPVKNTGSTVKIDNLHGGMLVAKNVTNYTFEPLLPFGFYTSCSGHLNYGIDNVSAYKDLGFNAINPVCAFTDGELGYLFDWMDEVYLWYQYDMRGSYLNLTSVAEQIPLVKDRSAFLSWYTADEPDGWQYALNSTRLAYDLLKEQDPYHPTGLVLNCDNYHFKEYSSGADYIMEDAYPIGINPHHSRPWSTTCNETYGDCGCDNCIGRLQDVSDRLDSYFDYQDWLGKPQKPIWSVLQAFSGEGYWIRDPTPMETFVMILLSFNHMAKAIMSWQFPSSAILNEAHSAFAKVATAAPASHFLLDADPVILDLPGETLLDVSYWILDNQVMVGFVNLDHADSNRTVRIELPVSVRRITSQPWGSLAWTLNDGANNGSVMSICGLGGLATSVVILDL